MTRNVWFAFYPSDWLNGTAGLPLETVGAYIQITALLYDHENAYPLDRKEHPVTGKLEGYCYKTLARRLNSRADKVERIISDLIRRGKLANQGGYLTSKRVARELTKREMKSRSSKEAAQKRWQVQPENLLKINKWPMR